MAWAHNDIDPEDVASWPRLTHSWAEACADRLAGSTVHVGDLAISPEQEDEFRRTFGPSKLVLYHNTRLLPHEVQDIRSVGLRLLDEKLVEDRIRLAIAHGALTGAARRYAETGNIYAISSLAAMGSVWGLYEVVP